MYNVTVQEIKTITG